ncbi:hypothetical protein PA08_1083 [Cutibacterium modestum P08]|nr:hypothetical protein PA08_1083 [Cutibacterium modestum P08]
MSAKVEWRWFGVAWGGVSIVFRSAALSALNPTLGESYPVYA